MNGLELSHLSHMLLPNEIDVAHIDHSLTYYENKSNLSKQFGVKPAYEKPISKYQDMAEANNSAPYRAPLDPSPKKFVAFDPIAKAKEIESKVMQGSKRSYYRVRFAPRFDCPVTVDSVGCCLSCAYCWNALRNEHMKLGKFYEPDEIADKVVLIASKENMWRFRISGCETILGKASTEHFCTFMDSILQRPKGKKAFFLLETNGMILGSDESLVETLAAHKEHLAVRVAVKGENPKQFEKLSGAKASSFKYQKLALDYCYKHEIPSLPAIMSTFMDVQVVSKYLGIVADDIDQEKLKFYPITKKSLIERGCWEMRKVKE